MTGVEIVAVVYQEPSYCSTRDAIEASGVPVHWVDRKGVGSLSEAINRGAREASAPLVWCVTNVVFSDDVLPRLVAALSARSGWAAIQPSYNSDHVHLQPDGTKDVKEGPYVEFTAPLVRRDVLLEHPLNERMPYWGHDLDWGHRVRQAGWKIGADMGVQVGHVYIRNVQDPHPITTERQRRRTATDRQTRRALRSQYGARWREVLQYR